MKQGLNVMVIQDRIVLQDEGRVEWNQAGI